MTKLSRRDFLKYAGLGAAGLTAAVATACADTEEEVSAGVSGAASTGEATQSDYVPSATSADGTVIAGADAVIEESVGIVEGSYINVWATGGSSNPVPYVATGSLDKMVCRHVYDGLVGVQANDTSVIIPALAKEWEVSEDGLTYTFHLRDNAVFSNGKKFSSADVVACMDLYKATTGASVNFTKIIEYSAPDEYTFELKLEQPFLTLPFLLTNTVFPIIDVEAAQANPTSVEGAIGTGAYILDSIVPDESVTYKANPDFWGELAEIETVKFCVITNNDSAFIAFQNGEVDTFQELSEQQLALVKDNESIDLWYLEHPTVHALWFDTGDEIFKDARVREGIIRLIDKEQVVLAGFGSLGFIDDCWIGPQMEGYIAGDCLEYDPDKGLELLKEAGVEPTELSFSILYMTSTMYSNCCQNIQSQLSKYGINVILDGYDFFTAISKMFAGEWQTVFCNVDATPAEPLDTYTAAFIPGKFNVGKLNTGMPELYEEIAAKISDAQVALSQEEREKILTEISTLVFQNNLCAPFGSYYKYYAYNNRFDAVYSICDGSPRYQYWRLADQH